MKTQGEHYHDHGGVDRQKQGVSSFDMQDSQLVFGELKLNQGDFFLDLGCGKGDYAIQASKIVGHNGRVYALDRWKEVIDAVKEKARSLGLHNISAIEADVISSLPIEERLLMFVWSLRHFTGLICLRIQKSYLQKYPGF